MSVSSRASSIISRTAASLKKVAKTVQRKAKVIVQSKSSGSKNGSKAPHNTDVGKDSGNNEPNTSKWSSGYYQFYHPNPKVLEDKDGRQYQEFRCAAKPRCKSKGAFQRNQALPDARRWPAVQRPLIDFEFEEAC
ncbi:hypothetical protein MIND_01151800 [Mycena indigotica]|uniref:Uncharacterized protein n=1 Tax=Mycena indigotica TaxID=2126181 RepID=A0A8H6VVS2_9AGAR|nr:uncharacterized protein MIND_01151800 [Mycena indigotica]KAF7293716.1 hypothetical protein MIND_01151800 [Mycena indigotica]